MNRAQRRREKWDEFIPYGTYDEFVSMVGTDTAKITMAALRLPTGDGIPDFDDKTLWQSLKTLRDRGYLRIWMRWDGKGIAVLPEFIDPSGIGGRVGHAN